MKTYFVYIMTNRSRTLYTGMTGNLEERVRQHKSKQIPGFTQKYHLDRLAYFDEFQNVHDAIAREKEIKGWLRKRKIDLIESINPEWCDLAVDLDRK